MFSWLFISFCYFDGARSRLVQILNRMAGPVAPLEVGVAERESCANKSSPMPRTALVLLLFLMSVVIGLAGGEPVTEIPFRFTDGFICLEARVTPSGEPLNLLLDSGAGASVLSLRTARRLKCKLGPAESVRGVGSEAAAYRLNPVRAIAGGVALPAMPLAVDLSMADELCSRPIDGLIGVEFFKDRIVQIDYARHCLRLRGPDFAMATGERLPIRIKNGILCVPVGVNDSQPQWTRFDTGCNDALHWVIPRPQERATRAGISIGFVTSPTDTALTTVSLGSRAMDQVKTSLHGRPLFEGEAGLLGNGLLSRFLVTVDWPNRQVILDESPR